MAEKLYSVKELAEAEGVSRYCMAGRIRSLRVEPSGYRWERNHFVGLYPRTIMDEWRERSCCSGWYALQTVVGWIKKGTGITECFLDASGWETRMSDGRRQWLIPQDMRDADKIREAFEKWKRSTYYNVPEHLVWREVTARNERMVRLDQGGWYSKNNICWAEMFEERRQEAAAVSNQ